MKACQPFKDWLESSLRLTLDDIPADLLQHASECQHCGKQLQALQQVRQQTLSDLPPATDMNKLWQRIDLALGPEKTISPDTDGEGLSLESAWKSLYTLLTRGNRPAIAGILVIIALIINWGLFRNFSALPWSKIEGNGGELIRSSHSQPLASLTAVCAPQDQVELSSLRSWAKISFRDGRSIALEGSGLLRLLEDGFHTENGHFRASFSKSAGGFKVQVPGAVLGIRGTAIQFDLQDGKGTLQLIEGQVEVTPGDGRPPFEWKPLSTLQISAGKLLSESEPAADQPLDPDILRNRSTEY